METALVDTIAAAITGADDLNEKLKATTGLSARHCWQALVNAGINGSLEMIPRDFHIPQGRLEG